MKKRKIAMVTGARCSYGLYLPVLEAIDKNPKLDYSLIVTGLHLSNEYGHTIDEIKKDGWKIDSTIDMLFSNDNLEGQVSSLFVAGIGFTQSLVNNRPDILLVQGDRGETIASAIAGAHLNIPVAHMHGGEINGTIDELIRHATTKFSHIHFPSTKKSAERIVKMGEEDWRVYLVGATGLDALKSKQFIKPEVLAKKYNLKLNEPLFLVLQHSCSSEVEDSEKQMNTTLEAIKELNYQTLVIYPNADAGNRGIISTINKFVKQSGLENKIKSYKNIEHIDYLSLMNISSAIIGNSSGAILEAPSLGLPIINIGTRQYGREKTPNTIDVGYNKEEIKLAIRKTLEDKDYLKMVNMCESPYNPFGTFNAGERITEILSNIKIDDKLLNKKLNY